MLPNVLPLSHGGTLSGVFPMIMFPVLGLLTLGLPLYVFEDVLKLSNGAAAGFSGIVWGGLTLVFAGTGLEQTLSYVIHHLYGWWIDDSVLIIGGIITVLRIAAALEYLSESRGRRAG